METNFKSVHTPKDIIISTIVILAGVGSYFLNPALGVTLASCGLLMLCFFKKGYKADGKEQVLTKVAMDMSASYLQPLKDFLGGKSIDLNLGGSLGCGAFACRVQLDLSIADAGILRDDRY